MASFKSVLLLVFFFTFSAHASIIAYADRGDWLSALPAADIVIEDFDGAAVNFAADSSGNLLGELSVSLSGGGSDPGPTGLTGKGFFQTEVDASGSDQLAVEISFADAWGFAFEGLQNDSLSKPSNLNLSEIALTIGAQSWVLGDLWGQDTDDVPFLGFVSDSVINSFQFQHARLITHKGGTSEEFYLDQLSLARVHQSANSFSLPAASVAEPPTLLLFSVAGMVLITIKIRHKQG